MIGFFPDTYLDELIYSACSTYTQRVDYPNKQTAMIDLFGKKGLSAIVDFPTYLEYFLSTFSSHNYSVDEIIDKNTLYSFYESFVIAERAAIIRQEMKSIADNHLQSRLATNIKRIKSPDFLRF